MSSPPSTKQLTDTVNLRSKYQTSFTEEFMEKETKIKRISVWRLENLCNVVYSGYKLFANHHFKQLPNFFGNVLVVHNVLWNVYEVQSSPGAHVKRINATLNEALDQPIISGREKKETTETCFDQLYSRHDCALKDHWHFTQTHHQIYLQTT